MKQQQLNSDSLNNQTAKLVEFVLSTAWSRFQHVPGEVVQVQSPRWGCHGAKSLIGVLS